MRSSTGVWATPEARQLRVGQRLGQLEDARHVVAVKASQRVVVEAASEGGEQLLASEAADEKPCQGK